MTIEISKNLIILEDQTRIVMKHITSYEPVYEKEIFKCNYDNLCEHYCNKNLINCGDCVYLVYNKLGNALFIQSSEDSGDGKTNCFKIIFESEESLKKFVGLLDFKIDNI